MKTNNCLCSVCQTSFHRRPSHQRGKVLVCSPACHKRAYALGLIHPGPRQPVYGGARTNRNQVVIECPHCKNSFRVSSSMVHRRKSCSKACRYALRLKLTETSTAKNIYRSLKFPDGKRILEHRWIMEQHLGRPLLRSEEVHHINGNSLDNRLENLEVIDASQHRRLHTIIPQGKVVGRYLPDGFHPTI